MYDNELVNLDKMYKFLETCKLSKLAVIVNFMCQFCWPDFFVKH